MKAKKIFLASRGLISTMRLYSLPSAACIGYATGLPPPIVNTCRRPWVHKSESQEYCWWTNIWQQCSMYIMARVCLYAYIQPSWIFYGVLPLGRSGILPSTDLEKMALHDAAAVYLIFLHVIFCIFIFINYTKGALTLTGRGHTTLVFTIKTAKSKCGHRNRLHWMTWFVGVCWRNWGKEKAVVSKRHPG